MRKTILTLVAMIIYIATSMAQTLFEVKYYDIDDQQTYKGLFFYTEYFKGGIVSYCDQVKHSILGVQQQTLDAYTAVSEQTVREMAEGVRMRLNTDYAVATTGVAGPTGGSTENPVGTVWMAVATPTQTITKKMHYGSRRQQVIERAVNETLAMLVRIVVNSQ